MPLVTVSDSSWREAWGDRLSCEWRRPWADLTATPLALAFLHLWIVSGLVSVQSCIHLSRHGQPRLYGAGVDRFQPALAILNWCWPSPTIVDRLRLVLTVSSYCWPSLAVLTILLFFYSRYSLLSSRLTAHMSHVILNEWLFPTIVDSLRLCWLCISNYCWPSSSILELMSSSGIDRLQLVLTVSSGCLWLASKARYCAQPSCADWDSSWNWGSFSSVDSIHSPHAPFNFARVDRTQFSSVRVDSTPFSSVRVDSTPFSSVRVDSTPFSSVRIADMWLWLPVVCLSWRQPLGAWGEYTDRKPGSL